MSEALRLEMDVVGIRCLKCEKQEGVENEMEAEAFVRRHMVSHFAFADFSIFELECRVATPGKFNGKFITARWRKK